MILIPLIVGVAMLVMGKVRKNKEKRLKGYKILKEWLLLALLFSQLILAISLSLCFSYDGQK